MVELQPSKLTTRVRFPSPAPDLPKPPNGGFFLLAAASRTGSRGQALPLARTKDRLRTRCFVPHGRSRPPVRTKDRPQARCFVPHGRSRPPARTKDRLQARCFARRGRPRPLARTKDRLRTRCFACRSRPRTLAHSTPASSHKPSFGIDASLACVAHQRPFAKSTVHNNGMQAENRRIPVQESKDFGNCVPLKRKTASIRVLE